MTLYCSKKTWSIIINSLRLKPVDPAEQTKFLEYRNKDIADMSIYILSMGIIVFIQNSIELALEPTLENLLPRIPLTLSLIGRVAQHMLRFRFNRHIGYMMTIVYLLQMVAVMVLNHNIKSSDMIETEV